MRFLGDKLLGILVGGTRLRFGGVGGGLCTTDFETLTRVTLYLIEEQLSVVFFAQRGQPSHGGFTSQRRKTGGQTLAIDPESLPKKPPKK